MSHSESADICEQKQSLAEKCPSRAGRVAGPRAWPRDERPRERLLARGAAALSDAELLAVCLGTGTGRLDCVGLARALLGEFGDLRALLNAPPARLLRCRGVGPAKVAAMKAALALALRHDEVAVRAGSIMDGSHTVRRYLQRALAAEQREVFACLFADSRHRMLGFERLFFGSVDRANVYPREVLKRSLALNAAAVILAHNHPSGVAEPSASDIALTQRLTRLLAEVDVRVLDHVIVAGATTLSFADRCLL